MECLLISGMQRLLALFQRPETGKNNRKSLWLLSLQLGGRKRILWLHWTVVVLAVVNLDGIHFLLGNCWTFRWRMACAECQQRYGRKKNRTAEGTVDIKFRAATHFQKKERFPLFLHHIFHKFKSTSFGKGRGTTVRHNHLKYWKYANKYW
jgi:hypothetical protein